jgi:hypothetical protein
LEINQGSNTELLSEDNQIQANVLAMFERSELQALSIHPLFYPSVDIGFVILQRVQLFSSTITPCVTKPPIT